MKWIPTLLGAAVALTLLAGCAGDGTYGTYYGRPPAALAIASRIRIPATIGTTNTIAGTATTIIPEIPITITTVTITAADTRACKVRTRIAVAVSSFRPYRCIASSRTVRLVLASLSR